MIQRNSKALQHAMRLRSQYAGSRGYMLITLMLFLALLAIGMMAVLPEIKHQIRRDHEEEMTHRALGYARAIKRYYRKFGRYPNRLEELENTNDVRFVRKHYKDPITGEEFRILHLTDILRNNGGATPGPGLNPTGGIAGPGLNPTGGIAGPGLGPSGGIGGQNPIGQNANPVDSGANTENAATGDAKNGNSGDSSAQGNSGPFGAGPSFGGGPIVGVASASKDETIREYNHKNHYKDWFFIYLANLDRGGLITEPTNPDMITGLGLGAQGAPNLRGAPGVPIPSPPGQQPAQPPQGPTNPEPQPQPQPPDQ